MSRPGFRTALEFTLDEIFRAGRFDEFSELLRGGSIGGLAGDPGWELERRDDQDDWPTGADFRAFVEPDSVHIAEPVNFCSRAELATVALTMLQQRLAVSHEQLTEVRRARKGQRLELASLLESLEQIARM